MVILGSFWGNFGLFLGHFGGLFFELFLAYFGCFYLSSLSVFLEVELGFCSFLGPILGHFWVIFGLFWGFFGLFLAGFWSRAPLMLPIAICDEVYDWKNIIKL